MHVRPEKGLGSAPFYELMLLYNNVAKLRQKRDGGHHAFARQNERWRMPPTHSVRAGHDEASGLLPTVFVGQETTANPECVQAQRDF